MKRIFIFLTFVFSLLLFTQAAQAYDIRVGGSGVGIGYYENNVVNFWSNPTVYGSAVYNKHRFGVEHGFNPYYVKSSPASNLKNRRNIGLMDIKTHLDYQVWKNPDLLRPRYTTNNLRDYRGLRKGFFSQYGGGPNVVTGDVRPGSARSALHSNY